MGDEIQDAFPPDYFSDEAVARRRKEAVVDDERWREIITEALPGVEITLAEQIRLETVARTRVRIKFMVGGDEKYAAADCDDRSASSMRRAANQIREKAEEVYGGIATWATRSRTRT